MDKNLYPASFVFTFSWSPRSSKWVGVLDYTIPENNEPAYLTVQGRTYSEVTRKAMKAADQECLLRNTRKQ